MRSKRIVVWNLENTLFSRFGRLGFGILLGMSLGACTSSEKNHSEGSDHHHGSTMSQNDQRILRDWTRAQTRGPSEVAASVNDGHVLEGLQKVSPRRFEVFVFPKNSNQTHREKSDSGVSLGKPYKITVSPVYLGNCSFLGTGGFSKFNPKSYFPPELVSKTSKSQCAIIELTAPERDKALWLNGDILKKRIYIDDNYRAYGMETEFVSGSRDVQVGKHILDPKEGLSSALDGIPVDLPVLGAIYPPADAKTFEKIESFVLADLAGPSGEAPVASENKRLYDPKVPLDSISLAQIKDLNQKFELPTCKGKAFSYVDSMRKKVKVYWCDGKPWPQATETQQYFAVTQDLGGV